MNTDQKVLFEFLVKTVLIEILLFERNENIKAYIISTN